MATMRCETYDGETGALLSVEEIEVPDPPAAPETDVAALTAAFADLSDADRASILAALAPSTGG